MAPDEQDVVGVQDYPLDVLMPCCRRMVRFTVQAQLVYDERGSLVSILTDRGRATTACRIHVKTCDGAR